MKMNENETSIGGVQNIYIKYLVSVTSSFICYARIRHEKDSAKQFSRLVLTSTLVVFQL